MCQPRIYALCLALCAFAPLMGCELVADFDRKRIPSAESDAGIAPAKDASSDEEDAGSNQDGDDASVAAR